MERLTTSALLQAVARASSLGSPVSVGGSAALLQAGLSDGVDGRRRFSCDNSDNRAARWQVVGSVPAGGVGGRRSVCRRDHRIVSVAVIVAVGVNSDGRREVLGMTTGHSEAASRSGWSFCVAWRGAACVA